ncbi:hypothetical protein GCM10009592_28480 [Brachybacterium rhamnosum]|uniref:Uncharacterized protein n=1 Tax=Brachybacterium rhamnosum TaxID=173361 RepID=A0ABW4Q3R1_9MICO
MTNRPKQIGTAGESAVVATAQTLGFPWAERLVLHGAKDIGDVRLALGVHLEVKSGHAAETASDALIETWMRELETELENADALAGALITKRKGISGARAHLWWAHVRSSWLATWRCYPPHPAFGQVGPDATVRMTLDSLLAQLRATGYGDPLPTDTTTDLETTR